MSDAASQAKLRALAAYYRNGGQDPNVARGAMAAPDNSGNIGPGNIRPMPVVQDVPGYAMHNASVPEGHVGAGTLDQLEAVRAAQLAQNNLAGKQEPEFDTSGFAPYQGPRQFPGIQKKIQAGQPINSNDIRNSMHGVQEVTPELEKKLGYGKQDEDEE